MSQAAPAQHSAPAVSFDEQVLKEAQRVITDDAITPNQRLTHLLSMMIWHRSRLLQEYLLQNAHHNQIAVMGGVFEGLLMSLPIHAGIALPMILGSYESELHSAVRNAMRRGYQHVVNIGCGDGYYLVGMARHMKATQFFGYDVNPAAQQGCQQTANHNGVAERVTIGGLFAGADFAQHPAGETLVICDIEGAED